MKKLILMMSFIFLSLNLFSEDKKTSFYQTKIESDDCYLKQQKQARKLQEKRSQLIQTISEFQKQALYSFDILIYEANYYLVLGKFKFCKAYRLNKWYTDELKNLVLKIPKKHTGLKYERARLKSYLSIKNKIEQIKTDGKKKKKKERKRPFRLLFGN